MDRARPPDRGCEAARERWAAPLVLAALLLAACGGRTYLTPEVAGVVVAREAGTDATTVYRLASGQEYTIDITNGDAVVDLLPPDVGDLLLGGTGADGPWVARLPKSQQTGAPADCYELGGFGTDRGAWIETDAGFRLPKAPGFDPGPVRDVRDGARYEWTPAEFCVNPDGQVTSFG